MQSNPMRRQDTFPVTGFFIQKKRVASLFFLPPFFFSSLRPPPHPAVKQSPLPPHSSRIRPFGYFPASIPGAVLHQTVVSFRLIQKKTAAPSGTAANIPRRRNYCFAGSFSTALNTASALWSSKRVSSAPLISKRSTSSSILTKASSYSHVGAGHPGHAQVLEFEFLAFELILAEEAVAVRTPCDHRIGGIELQGEEIGLLTDGRGRIASILASFHVVPSSFLSWPALPQAAIIISSAAAAKYFFITYL